MCPPFTKNRINGRQIAIVCSQVCQPTYVACFVEYSVRNWGWLDSSEWLDVTPLCVNISLQLSQGTFIFLCSSDKNPEAETAAVIRLGSSLFLGCEFVTKALYSFTFTFKCKPPRCCWRCWREERGAVKNAWYNRWPSVLALCRIQRNRPAQRDGRQRLLPGEGLETHTAAVWGSFVEEAADCQTESEGILCSGEKCCSRPRTQASLMGCRLPDQWRQGSIIVIRWTLEPDYLYFNPSSASCTHVSVAGYFSEPQCPYL